MPTFPFDLVIMLGDNMYGGQQPADFVKKFEQPYAPLLAAGVKFQASLGNHDRPENVSYKPFNMNGQRYYTYVRNNVRFFALDSTLMDRKQVAWIEAALRDAREDWKICYFHHPLYSNADRHGSSVDLRVLLEPIFVKHGVNVVFSGHDHVYERLKPQKGIYYFVSGAAGQLRRGNMRPLEPDRRVLRSGPELHARRNRRSGDVLPGDLAHRQDRRFRRDPPAGRGHGDVSTPRRIRRAGEEPFRACRGSPSSTCCCCPWAALIALVWVNTGPESYYRFTYAIAFAVNDVAMVFFFALMTKEVVEATAPGGVLHPWRRALLPVIASIGATMVPALIYVRVVDVLDEPMLAVGWPVSFATDLAVSYFVARIIFRPHPAIPFLLLLAIASDALGFLALALFNPTEDLHLARRRADPGRRDRRGLRPAAGAGQKLLAVSARRRRPLVVRALLERPPSGARARSDHAVPAPRRARSGILRRRTPDARDTLSQFEVWWRYPAQVALFFFGLVNAGVPLRALEAGTWGLPIAVIVGKPLGILIARGRPRRRPAPAAPGWLARADRGGIHRRDRFQCRAVLLRGAAASGPAALGNQHGCASEPRRSAARPCAARLLRVGRFAR